MSTRVTAASTVLERLRAAIALGEIEPGEHLRQEALAERYGVSRVPLREALQTLVSEGQIAHEPHRGYFVVELSIDDLTEVYRLRSLLEGEAARVAVEHASDAQVTRLEELCRAVEGAARRADVPAMVAANRSFHLELIDAAGMPRLSRIVRSLWDATDAYRSVYYGSATNRRTVIREHRAILEALRARDADRVVRELDSHRHSAVASLSSLVSRR